MDISSIQDWLILASGFITGGGLTTLFLLPSKRKKEEVSVIQDVQLTYQKMVADLVADRELWKTRYEELQIKVDRLEADAEQRDRTIKDLQKQLGKQSKQIAKSKPNNKP